MTTPSPTRRAVILSELWRGVRGGLFWSVTIYGGLLLVAGLIALARAALGDASAGYRGVGEWLLGALFMLVGVAVVWTAIAAVVGLVRGLERCRLLEQDDAAPDAQLKARQWRMLRCVLAGTTLGVANVLLVLLIKPTLALSAAGEAVGVVGIWATVGWLVGLCIDGVEGWFR